MGKKIIIGSKKKRKMVCPKCGGKNIKTIVYGFLKPKSDKEWEEFEKTSVRGGCMVGADSSRFYCDSCGKRFGEVKVEIVEDKN